MKRAGTILLVFGFASLVSTSIRAVDGDLDPTFGIGGKIATSFGVPAVTGQAVALQPDGKIVIAGWLFDETANVDFALARYGSDGSLDATFGMGGRVRTDFFGQFDNAYALAIQPDGKLLVGGLATNGLDVVFALARYNPDGSLDSTFDSDGKVTGAFFGGISDLVLQPDGKIVVAGFSFPPGGSGDMTVARYNSDGSLDLAFGTLGVVRTDFSGLRDGADSLLLLPDGKLLALGFTETNITGIDIALARYNSDGSPDLTFGSGGKVTTDFGAGAYDAALQSDGKIVVAAGIIVRYLPNGELDSSFGNQGSASIDFPGFDEGAYAVAVQRDGKIVTAGFAFGSTLYDFAISRFNPDGSADISFGSGGNGGVITDFFQNSDAAHEVLIQPDGRIVAVGGAADQSVGYIALARYEATPVAPTPTSCPHSSGFWKTHPAEWPVSSLTVGSQSYFGTELADLLGAPTRGDASLFLARELITAKLNVAGGAGSSELVTDISSGDELLSKYRGKLPYGVSPDSGPGRRMVSLAGNLASRNNRRSQSTCP